LLSAADLTIDHVTVAGRDLKKMQAQFQSVGIRTEYGGRHNNRVTEMALTSFPDGSYLEIIALQPGADSSALAGHEWSRQMQGSAGPCAWAVTVKDLDTEVARLRAAGIAVSSPVRSGRVRPDGTRLEWETAQVGDETRGTFFPFLIRDFSPRADRAYPSGKPTTRDFAGVKTVVIAVHDLKASAERYRKVYGLEPPIQQVDAEFGAHLALLGGTPVVLAAPLTEASWLAKRIEQFGDGPCAFILSAHNARKYGAAAKSRWFGMDISWFDTEKLGWRLGFR
jgi:hypothetical protein